MDLTQPINYNVLVEREGFSFFSEIEYENLPDFCFHCKKIRHDVQHYKLLKKPTIQQIPKTKVAYVPKPSSKSQEEPLRPIIDGVDHNTNNDETRVDGPILVAN